MEPLLTSDEVAAYLRVDVVTIRRLVNRGELPAYRVGGEYRFKRRELEEYLQRQRMPGADEERVDMLSALALLARKLFGGSKVSGGGPVSDGFARFTPGARNALQLAQAEAHRLHHHFIGTEHVLLGLVREGEGVAAQALLGMGVDLEAVRARVEFIIGHGEHEGEEGEVPLTRRAKKVIELAVDEAIRLDHVSLGTEHLLLGLIREGDGLGAHVLRELGVDLRTARAKVIELLGAQQAADGSTEEQKKDETAEGE